MNHRFAVRPNALRMHGCAATPYSTSILAIRNVCWIASDVTRRTAVRSRPGAVSLRHAARAAGVGAHQVVADMVSEKAGI